MNSKFVFLIATLLVCVRPALGQAQALPQQADESKPADISTAESLIDAQLAAYNRRDVEGFLSYYSEAAVLVNYPDQITEMGKEAMRVLYKKSFANPDVRATIAKRIVFGNFVIDHEQLTRAPAPGMIEAIAVYEIKDGKIVRVTFLKQ